MYCSNKCKFAGRSSPKAEKVWELRKSNPELSVGELAKAIGTTKGYVETSLYINKHRPSDLLKRKYKPRQPKKEVIEPEPEPEPPPEPVKEPEPLPEGKYGKHVAPGWLWNGAGALEEKYGHLGERKKK